MQRLLHGTRLSLAGPSRNPRMATILGRLLGSAFLITFATGLYSHFLQNPLPWMQFPTRPAFLYQLTQGIHITVGILCVPLILGKLYVVFPNLLQTPPVRSFAHFLERASIALFVAASIVELATGLLNTYQWYSLFPFPFRQTHFALSFVIIGSLAIHIAVKLETITKYWRKKDSYDAAGNLVLHDAGQQPDAGQRQPGRHKPARGEPEVGGMTGRVFAWIDRTPAAEPSTSRRGFLVTIGVAAAAVVTLTAGQSFRFLDFANVFAPRKNDVGPDSVPINRTAKAAKVAASALSPDWVLTVSNGNTHRAFSRAELQAMPQFEVELPIACVEGWSQLASWKGPRLRDLADTVGAHPAASLRARSLEKGSIYAVMEMGPEFVRDELTLMALEVNGRPLDLDHGYPARMIAPARAGVLQTKWLSSLEVIAS